MHQQSVIPHRYRYNHTSVKSCRLHRLSLLVLTTNYFDPSVAHSACTILAMLFSASFLFSLCVSSLQAIVLYTHRTTLRNVLITAKKNTVRYKWFCKPSLYTWFCIPTYVWFCIPSLVIHGFVYHCIHGSVYYHSLYMVLYTIVYMVLCTITRYTWFCISLYTWFSIPSLVIRGSVYHCIPGTWFCIPSFLMASYTIVGHKNVSFSSCVNPEPCKRACEGQQ